MTWKEQIKIIIRAFEHKLVDNAAKKILVTVLDSGAKVSWVIPLPTKIEKITLNRSTFVNKDAREQFEIRRHKRILVIKTPTDKTLELLQSVSIPSWVWIDIKVG